MTRHLSARGFRYSECSTMFGDEAMIASTRSRNALEERAIGGEPSALTHDVAVVGDDGGHAGRGPQPRDLAPRVGEVQVEDVGLGREPLDLARHRERHRRRGDAELPRKPDDLDAAHALGDALPALVGDQSTHGVAALDERVGEVAQVVLDPAEVRRVVLVDHRDAQRAGRAVARCSGGRARPAADAAAVAPRSACRSR